MLVGTHDKRVSPLTSAQYVWRACVGELGAISNTQPVTTSGSVCCASTSARA